MIQLKQAGDTLVEVMLSVAILSLVLAGAFTITNRATRINQSANERTQVSNLIQAEAEKIKAIHQVNAGDLWSVLSDSDVNTPRYVSGTNVNYCTESSGSTFRDGAFFVKSDLTLEKINLNGDGEMQDANSESFGTEDFFDVWVEAVDRTEHVDFYIYACWEGIGGESIQRSGLVTRLLQ